MVVVSQEAQNLLEGRPDWWEYKLFALLHRDAFSDFERPDLLQPPLRPEVGSTFLIESASDFAATVQSLVDLLARLVESMEGSINISSHDMTRCFGPPGQSGDPQSIQTLIYRLRSHAKDCCERLARVQALKISSSNASVHEAAQFFLRSVVSYANHEFDQVAGLLKPLGQTWLDELQGANPKLTCQLKLGSPLWALEPLQYAVRAAFEFPPPDRASKSPTVVRDRITASFIDTETTGLDAHDEPISIGAVKYEVHAESGSVVREVGRYYGLRQPNVPIGAGAFQVHGIEYGALAGLQWDLDQLTPILDADILIAHNADFDCRMVNKVLPTKRSNWFCTMTDLADLWGRDWVSLESLTQRYPIEVGQPHHAMDDALVVSRIVQSPLPPPAAGKPILWEVIRRHYKLPAVEFDGRDMWVWGRYDKHDGRLLLVRAERYGLPLVWDAPFVDDYIRDHVPQGCVDYPLDGYLSFGQAMDAKDQLLRKHVSTVLNHTNPHQAPWPTIVDGDQKREYYECLERGRALEKDKPKVAIELYQKALAVLMAVSIPTPPSDTLLMQIVVAGLRRSLEVERMAIKVLDRLTLTLCRQGQPQAAQSEYDKVKSKYPQLPQAEGHQAIEKRLVKALSTLRV